jgi:hypothetical protein
LAQAKEIIEKNIFTNIDSLTLNTKVISLLNHYSISREEISKTGSELSKIKAKFDKLSRTERFSILEYVE